MTRLVIAAWLLALLAGCGGAAGSAPPASAAQCPSRCEVVAPSSPFSLAVLGSGGPHSFGRAGAGYVVFVDGVARVLVDVGPGAFVHLGKMGVDLDRLDIVLLTHLHVDHVGDLAAFVKSRDVASHGPRAFRVFGPPGAGLYPSTSVFVEGLFGEHGAFAYLPSFRNTLDITATNLPLATEVHEVLVEGNLKISAVAVDHGDVPAVAYRIELEGRSLVVSGDLASNNDNLARLAEGADLLVYDAAVLDPPASPAALYELHTPPRRIGEVARAAHVHALLLSHLPRLDERAREAVLRSVTATFEGNVGFADDCMRLDLTGGDGQGP